MKKLILSCLLFAGAQLSADCCCSQEQFDGFYIGGNLGVISHTAYRQDYDGFLTDNSGWTDLDTAFTGGVQAGWNWQCGNRVLGIVADWNKVTTGTQVQDNPNNNTTPSNYFQYDMNWFTTIRAKAGLAVCDAQVYITAGAAIASFENSWLDDPIYFKDSNTCWGWAGGAGAEYILCGNWTAGLEVLFMHFANNRQTFDNASTLYRFGASDSAWTGRLLVNYKFDLCSCW